MFVSVVWTEFYDYEYYQIDITLLNANSSEICACSWLNAKWKRYYRA